MQKKYEFKTSGPSILKLLSNFLFVYKLTESRSSNSSTFSPEVEGLRDGSVIVPTIFQHWFE